MVYIYNTKMDNVFDMEMLKNLDSDKIYKLYKYSNYLTVTLRM